MRQGYFFFNMNHKLAQSCPHLKNRIEAFTKEMASLSAFNVHTNVLLLASYIFSSMCIIQPKQTLKVQRHNLSPDCGTSWKA